MNMAEHRSANTEDADNAVTIRLGDGHNALATDSNSRNFLLLSNRCALAATVLIVVCVLTLNAASPADAADPTTSGPPITKDSLLGAGGVTLATWLISSTFQQVTGRSSKLFALVVALGVGIIVQFLTDASSTGLIILLGVLNGCQAYLTAAGVASVSGALTSPESRAGGTIMVQRGHGFFDSWF
jgi:hypothetical protein